MESRRALPWVLSLALHAAIVLVPVGMLVSPLPKAGQELRINVALAASPGLPSEGSGTVDAPGVGAAVALPMPGASTGVASALPLPGVSIAPPQAVASYEGAAIGAETGSLALPSAQDVLSDLPSTSPIMPGDVESGTASSGVPPGSLETAAAGPQQRGGMEIAWQGSPRKVIRWRDPEFPAVLSATGQEVECEARITVAPSGAIIHVDITKSSGYTEIDASVEAALRDNLFSRVSGKTDTIAMVKYRFRPEKQD